jgi:hypothetical protein
MNKLEEYFWNGKKQLTVCKWHHYFKIYDRHFKKFQGRHPIILEIGVAKGGSLEMWNHYFDGDCEIYAIDINPDCLQVPKRLDAKNIHVELGNQESRSFWRDYLRNKPKFDIVIDDGGHKMNQQIVTYEEVYNHISDDGVYLCEDLHTSYWEMWGGGLRKPGTFIEYTKNFIDQINAHHIREPLVGNEKKFRQTTNSIHYYDSVIVLEKEIDIVVPEFTYR